MRGTGVNGTPAKKTRAIVSIIGVSAMRSLAFYESAVILADMQTHTCEPWVYGAHADSFRGTHRGYGLHETEYCVFRRAVQRTCAESLV